MVGAKGKGVGVGVGWGLCVSFRSENLRDRVPRHGAERSLMFAALVSLDTHAAGRRSIVFGGVDISVRWFV